MIRKFIKILGVKIPFKNIRSTPIITDEMIGRWISYRFIMTMLPPPRKIWSANEPQKVS